MQIELEVNNTNSNSNSNTLREDDRLSRNTINRRMITNSGYKNASTKMGTFPAVTINDRVTTDVLDEISVKVHNIFIIVNYHI
jgi:hypothetical protein